MTVIDRLFLVLFLSALISLLAFSRTVRFIVWSTIRHPFKRSVMYRDKDGNITVEHE